MLDYQKRYKGNLKMNKGDYIEFIDHLLNHPKYAALFNNKPGITREDMIIRNLKMYLEYTTTKSTYKELAKKYDLTPNSVSHAVYRTERQIESFQKFKKLMNDINKTNRKVVGDL